MKRAIFAFALGLAGLTLTACDDYGHGYGYGYGGVYSASYPHYYDDYYYAPYYHGSYYRGPIYRGHRDNRHFDHRRRAPDRVHRGGRHWRDGDGRHGNWRRDRD